MKIYSGKSPVVEILNSMQDSKTVDEFYAIVNVPMEEPLFHKIFPGRNLGSMTFATAENFEINSSYCSNLVTVLVLQVTLKRPWLYIPWTTMFGQQNRSNQFWTNVSELTKQHSMCIIVRFVTCYNGKGNRHYNVLWDTNGLVSSTLAYWKDVRLHQPSRADSVSSWSSRMKTSITCEQSASWSELFSLRMLSPCICLINWRLFSISCVRTNRLVMVRIWMQPFRGKAFADKLQYNTRILIEITYPGVIQFGS